jgi:hypothetical protein
MTFDPEKRRRQRVWILGIRAALLLFFFTLLFSWLEPFAPRFQGKTVNGWLDEWLLTGSPVQAEVVDAFGTAVLPQLLRKIRTSGWIDLYGLSPWAAQKLSTALRADQRHQKVVDWLAVLDHRGHPVLSPLAGAGHSNLVLQLLSYHTLEELDKLIAAESDPAIHGAAVRLKGMIGARTSLGNIKGIMIPAPYDNVPQTNGPPVYRGIRQVPTIADRLK